MARVAGFTGTCTCHVWKASCGCPRMFRTSCACRAHAQTSRNRLSLLWKRLRHITEWAAWMCVCLLSLCLLWTVWIGLSVLKGRNRKVSLATPAHIEHITAHAHNSYSSVCLCVCCVELQWHLIEAFDALRSASCVEGCKSKGWRVSWLMFLCRECRSTQTSPQSTLHTTSTDYSLGLSTMVESAPWMATTG